MFSEENLEKSEPKGLEGALKDVFCASSLNDNLSLLVAAPRSSGLESGKEFSEAEENGRDREQHVNGRGRERATKAVTCLKRPTETSIEGAGGDGEQRRSFYLQMFNFAEGRKSQLA